MVMALRALSASLASSHSNSPGSGAGLINSEIVLLSMSHFTRPPFRAYDTVTVGFEMLGICSAICAQAEALLPSTE